VATFAALAAANIALLLVLCIALCAHPPVRAQQRPLQPSAPGYVAPAPKPAPQPATPAPTPAPEAAHRITLPPPPARNIIVLDPAHGGPETGALINDHLAEKDITLALAARLRATLQSHNFTIITTRDNDPAGGLTTQQRAEIANHANAIACLVIHATAGGNGVHLFTSALAPAERKSVLPWDTAQAAFLQQSAALQKELNTALANSHLATVNAQATVAPLDNLTCPAVAVEVAPYLADGVNTTVGVDDPDYQQHVVESIATALVFWRGHTDAAPPGGTQ